MGMTRSSERRPDRAPEVRGQLAFVAATGAAIDEAPPADPGRGAARAAEAGLTRSRPAAKPGIRSKDAQPASVPLVLTAEAKAAVIEVWARLLHARHGGTWEWVEDDPPGQGGPAARDDDAGERGARDLGQPVRVVARQELARGDDELGRGL